MRHPTAWGFQVVLLNTNCTSISSVYVKMNRIAEVVFWLDEVNEGTWVRMNTLDTQRPLQSFICLGIFSGLFPAKFNERPLQRSPQIAAPLFTSNLLRTIARVWNLWAIMRFSAKLDDCDVLCFDTCSHDCFNKNQGSRAIDTAP